MTGLEAKTKIKDIISKLQEMVSEIEDDVLISTLVSLSDFDEMKDKLRKYQNRIEDLEQEKAELYDKIDELEADESIDFYFVIHQDDWKYFRIGNETITGHKLKGVGIDDLIEVTVMLANLPETFRHCRIKFKSPEEIIPFIEYVSRHNIKLFSIRQF